jgi:hypothetical protein
MNDFLRRKEEWLLTVAAKVRERAPMAVAIAIFCHLNSEKETAWPTVELLAAEVEMSERNCHRAIRWLVKEGWLRCQRGGRRRANTYWLGYPDRIAPVCLGGRNPVSAVRSGHAADDRDPLSAVRSTPSQLSGFTPSQLSPQQKREQTKEPTRARARPASSSSQASRGGPSREAVHPCPKGEAPSREAGTATPSSRERDRPRQLPRATIRAGAQRRPAETLLPTDWEFGPREAEIAAASPAHWNADEARVQFERFREYHRDKYTMERNWLFRWKGWCQKGAVFARQTTSEREQMQDRMAAAATGFVRRHNGHGKREEPADG